jgi:hypothetical protein
MNPMQQHIDTLMVRAAKMCFGVVAILQLT